MEHVRGHLSLGDRLAHRFASRQDRGQAGSGIRGDDTTSVVLKALTGKYDQSQPGFQAGDRVVHDLGFPSRKFGTVMYTNRGRKGLTYIVKHDDNSVDYAVPEAHLAPDA